MSKSKQSVSKKLASFRCNRLPGDVRLVASIAEYSVSHTSKVLNGKRNPNMSIIDTAYDLVLSRKKRK